MENPKEFAISVAEEAGRLLMESYGKIKSLDWNTRTHFKTEVDDASDRLIRQRIGEFYAEHNIFSEEGDNLDTGSEFTWVCDSLDGTIPYTLGISDHFSVAIALVKGKTPILGVINAVKRNELYVAEQGKGAFCNDRPIKVCSEEEINHVIMGFDGGKETEHFKRASIARYLKKALSPDGITCPVSSGCASVPLCLTASGKLHAYMALSLEPWDMAAAVIINREAGAKVTTIDGKEWELGDESILAANPKLHAKLCSFLKVEQ